VPVELASDAPLAVADDYDGESAANLARRLAVPRVALYRQVGSTMDVAHALGEGGAPAGTLILADEQTAGRGRQGRSWRSAAGRGIWMTLLERPAWPTALEVLSLRMGLAAAQALDAFAPGPVRVKWPNDLFVGRGKLAGVLVEARWRGDRVDWTAIGLGVNVAAPGDVAGATGLSGGTSRLEVLASLVPSIRAAVARGGPLDSAELGEFAVRDHARGRRCAAPSRGVVFGISPTGELAVATSSGMRYHRTGSLLLEEDA
jgi:BirA family transcriptional regulator, biotin operon repressor / biotin---[acetyl-CoA-carboxylase] ligase